MKKTSTGWVIINIGHPTNGKKSIWADSFEFTRKECIANFVKDSGNTWQYWRNKFNFRCVQGTITVRTLTKTP